MKMVPPKHMPLNNVVKTVNLENGVGAYMKSNYTQALEFLLPSRRRECNSTKFTWLDVSKRRRRVSGLSGSSKMAPFSCIVGRQIFSTYTWFFLFLWSRRNPELSRSNQMVSSSRRIFGDNFKISP